MTGGTITGNGDEAVYLSSGDFTMEDGTIIGNDDYAVYVSSDGSFTMEGGTITGSVEEYVVCNYGSFTMEDGTITGNAGDYVVYNYGSFTMNGGELSGSGRDYVVANDADFCISGAAVIEGAVYLYEGKVITIGSPLADADEFTPIPVAMEDIGTFTSGWGEHMADAELTDYFASANKAYALSLTDDGQEAKLVEIELSDALENGAALSLGKNVVTLGDDYSYTFTPEADGKYLIYSAGGYDTYGKLYLNDKLLSQDDDSGEHYNFRLAPLLKAGNNYTLRFTGEDDKPCAVFVEMAAMTPWDELRALLAAGGEIKLEQDYVAVRQDECLQVPSGVEVVLDLNGHTIDGTAMNKDKHDVLIVNGSLSLLDSSEEGTGTLLGSKGNEVVYVYKGKFQVSGGTITGSKCNQVVYAVNSSLEIRGGTISGTDCGSVVYLSGESICMSGGAITGTDCDHTVYVSGGSISISGGAITGSDCENALYVSYGDLRLSGGTITGSGDYFCAVRFYGGNFALSGSPAINGSVFLGSGQPITVEGLLGYDTPIVVEMETLGVFTSGWSAVMGEAEPTDYFVGARSYYELSREGDELKLSMIPIKYLDADGVEQICTEYTQIGALGGTYSDVEWCVVSQNVSAFTVLLNAKDDETHQINLILCDGVQMDVSHLFIATSASSKAYLNIYGQSQGTGELRVGTPQERSWESTLIRTDGDMAIYGGCVSVWSTSQGYIGIGVKNDAALTIAGGKVKVDGPWYGLQGGNIVITGGEVDVAGQNIGIYATDSVSMTGGNVHVIGSSNPGVYTPNGGITLGWTKGSDSIYASSYYGDVTVADGQSFVTDDETPVEIPSGTVADKSTINGKTLTPAGTYSIVISDTEHGTFIAPAKALPGETVTLTVTPDEGYVLVENGLLVKNKSNFNYISVTDNQFVMPASDVTVTAAFLPAAKSVSYVDEDGAVQTATAYPLTEDVTTLPGGWYVAEGELNLNDELAFCGYEDVHLILADDCRLNGTGGYAVIGDTNVTIYGQSEQTGILNANGENGGVLAGFNLTICGGNVSASGAELGLSCNYSLFVIRGTVNANADGSFEGESGLWCGSVYISGGTVTAQGYEMGIYGIGEVVISGGNVSAVCGEDGIGGIVVYNDASTIKLGWTNPTDSIEINSYGAIHSDTVKVSVSDGQTLKYVDENGKHYFSDVLSDEEIDEISGTTLLPAEPYDITLSAAANGTLDANVTKAEQGDTVTLTVTPDEDYCIGTVTYNDGIDHTVTPNNDVYAFTMPNADVTVTATFKKCVTVTIDDQSKIYGEADPELTATVTGLGEGETLDYTLTRVEGEDAGEYAITAILGDNPDYAVTVENGTFTIIPASVTLSANSGTVVYDGTEQTLTGFTSSVEGLAFHGVTASGSGTNAGIYNVTFSGVTVNETKDSTGNYVVTGITNGKLTITPASVTLTANSDSVTYDGEEKTLTGFTSSVEGLSFVGVSASGSGTNVGSYDVTFTGVTLNETMDSTGNYVVNETVDGTLTIAKAVLTVTANDRSITYGDAPANNGVSYDGFVNGETEDVLNGTLGYSYSYTQYGDVGSYAINPHGLTSGNYEISFHPGTLTVEQKEIGLIWSNTSLTFNGEAQAPTAEADGTVNGDEIGVTVSGAQTDAGTNYTAEAVALTGEKAGNYKLPAESTTDFTINKAEAQTIADVEQEEIYTVTSIHASVAGKMPENAGTLTYTVGTAATTGSVNVIVFSVGTDGSMSAKISDGAEGDTITLPVTISSTNYNDSTVNVVITLVGKDDAGVSITGGNKTVTYGDTGVVLSGTVTNAGTDGAWSWISADTNVAEIDDTGALTIKNAGTTTITAKYESSTTLGEATITLTVDPKAVTVKADDKSKTYGDTDPELTANVEGTVGTDTLNYSLSRAAGENVGEYAINATMGENPNYEITTMPGVFTIGKKALTVTADSDAKVYDGTALTKNSYTNTDLVAGDAIESVTVTGSQTVVGTSDNVPSAAVIKNGNGVDVTACYKISYVNGALEVTKKAITVTADSATKVYDGTALTKNSYTNTEVVAGDAIESVTVTGSQTVVGTSDNVPSAAVIQNSDGVDVTFCYEISYVNGTLEVTKKAITVTADSDSKVYDGTALTKNSFTNTDLAVGDAMESVTVTGSQTVVGTSDNVPSAAVIQNSDGVDVTFCYEISYVNGTLEVTKKAITVTADSDSKVYDGTALTKNSFTNTDLAVGDAMESVTVTGSQTVVGTSENVPSAAVIKNGNGVDVTACYEISYVNGTLEVTKKAITVTADSATKVYDGTALTKNSYTNTELAVGDSVESVTVTGSQTVVGTSANVPSAAVIKNGSGEDVTFCYEISYVNGTLEVTEKAITVTAENKSKTYGETDPELTAIVEGLVAGDTLNYSLSRAAGENVGEYAITVILGENPNYEITTADGTLTISKKTATITAENKSKTYGDADPELTANIEGLVPGDTLNYSLSRAAGENVGEYAITVTLGENPNYEITTADGTLTINKADPSYTVPEGLVGMVGWTLSKVELPAGWTWADPTQQIETAGENTFKAIFTPDDTQNYNVVENIDLIVNVKLMRFIDVPEGSYFYDPVYWAVAHGITAGTSDTTFSPDMGATRAQVVTFLWRMAGSPEPTAATCPFQDVPENAYFYKPVLWALENHITAGTSATTFGSNDVCTREQVVTFLWRLAGSPDPETSECAFEDVDANGFAYKAILWAAENHITAGTSATTFGPKNTCTRAQIVTFLYRYHEVIG